MLVADAFLITIAGIARPWQLMTVLFAPCPVIVTGTGCVALVRSIRRLWVMGIVPEGISRLMGVPVASVLLNCACRS